MREELSSKDEVFSSGMAKEFSKNAWSYLLTKKTWICVDEDKLLNIGKGIDASGSFVPCLMLEALSWRSISENWDLLKQHPDWLLQGLEKRIKVQKMDKSDSRNTFPNIVLPGHELIPFSIKKLLWDEFLIPRESTWKKIQINTQDICSDQPSMDIFILIIPRTGDLKFISLYLAEVTIKSFAQLGEVPVPIYEARGEDSVASFTKDKCDIFEMQASQFTFGRNALSCLQIRSSKEFSIELQPRFDNIVINGGHYERSVLADVHAFVRTDRKSVV